VTRALAFAMLDWWPADYGFAAVERRSGCLRDLEDFIRDHRTHGSLSATLRPSRNDGRPPLARLDYL